jgi:putative DNA primase/helicase
MNPAVAADLRSLACALGGEVSGRQVLAPGPGHSHRDRSISIRIEPSAPDGFIVYSFAGDDPLVCKDYVRERLGLAQLASGLVSRSNYLSASASSGSS